MMMMMMPLTALCCWNFDARHDGEINLICSKNDEFKRCENTYKNARRIDEGAEIVLLATDIDTDMDMDMDIDCATQCGSQAGRLSLAVFKS